MGESYSIFSVRAPSSTSKVNGNTPKVPGSDILKIKDSRVTRHFTKDYFTWWYEEEDLKCILKPARGNWVDQSEIIHALFTKTKEYAKSKQKKHQWTWAEDEFIRSSYKFLSDNVIGLGLNIPGRIVKLRRLALGLSKGYNNMGMNQVPYKVVVWCERNDYEKDLEVYNLSKTIPSKDRPYYVWS